MQAADPKRFIPVAMVRRHLPAALALLLVIAGLVARPASAQDGAAGPNLVIVFDGSGSMWGRLDNSRLSKLVAMREGLARALSAHLPKATVGLTTFGARSNASCSAAETAVAPAPGQLGDIEQHLDGFNPQGRGPVVLGLETAGEAAAALTGPTRLLLIHDSPDNCGRDVCELASKLAARKPRLVVDVISLGLKAKDRDAMTCLTKATGGRNINAASMDEAVAAIEGVLANVAATRPVVPARPAPARPRPAQPAEKKKPKARPPASTGLALSARRAGSGVTSGHGITWQIRSAAGGKAAIERTVRRPSAGVALPPGRYHVTFDTELVSMSRDVEVRKGTMLPVVFEYGGGLIEVAGPAGGGAAAPPLGNDVVSLVRTGADGAAAEAVWSGAAGSARALLLDPGRYRVTVGNGIKAMTKTVDVAAGQTSKVGFAAATARLIVDVAGLGLGQSAGAEIRIARDVPGKPGERRVVARSAALRATFDLPPGPYQVSVKTSDTETSSLVILAAGQPTTHTARALQMALNVTSHMGQGPKIIDADVRYRLWRTDQLERPFVVSRDVQALFHLAPGKYRIESRIGLQNAVMIREFDVGTDPAGSLALRHRAGRVSFSVPDAAPAPRRIPYWEILDASGRLVWRSFEASPRVILAAGNYRVTMATKNNRFAARFAVAVGGTETVELQPQP